MANIQKIEGKKGVSYKLTAFCGYDSSGNQIRRTKTWRPEKGMTARQAEKEAAFQAELFEEAASRGIPVDSNIRFSEYASRWLDSNKNRFAPITFKRYETLLVRINKAIGNMKMGRITAMHLGEFYQNLTEITSETTGRPLSPQTIKHYHRCVAAILADATKKQVIPRNVASREFMNAPKVPKKEPPYLDDEQARRFVALLLEEEDIRKKAAFVILVYSGCRVGELAGLQWDDCNFEKQTITIRRSSQFCSGHGVFTKLPKNETSARTIRMPAVVFEILGDYMSWYDEQKNILGSKWNDSNRLFIQWDGKPIMPTVFNKWLADFVTRHGLPRITPHGLRHTNISLLISNGVDLRTVANKAGHSRTSTTSDIYSHVIRAKEEEATQVLDDILTPKNDKVLLLRKRA